MDDYCKLAVNSIQRVQETVKGKGDTALQLNDGQCKILAEELAELSVYLHDKADKFKGCQGIWQIPLLHLYSAIKKAEILVEKCCCKNSGSWLVAAMMLVEIQEDFASIIVDLHQWRLVVDFAIASATGASPEEKEALLMIMDEDYQELYKKLRRSNNVLQQAAVDDKKKMVLKLAEVQESENSLEYLRAIHLQSWLKQFEDETQVADSSVTQKLVEFEKPQVLGKGGCGTVLRVKWLGVHCALKMLNVRDEREATALKGLLHPNIIRLYRYWEAPSENPKSNLLMELMAMDLSVYIERRLKDMASSSAHQVGDGEYTMPFSLHVAIDIMLQVGQAMQYLHDRHMTHRDLKTSNILVRQVSEELTNFYAEGYVEIKLADFGLAKAYDNTSTSHGHTVNTGTPVYGAPEIFGKDLVFERNFPPMADVWSFGVTCAEILSGKKPYANEPRGTLQTRIAKGNLRPTLPKLCPEYLAFIIRGCWEFQPKRRPDFASVCRMLRHAKLLSLEITKLDDSGSCIGYITRSGVVKGLRDSKTSKAGITSRFATFLQTSFKYFKLSSIPEVRKISNGKGLVQGAEEAEEKEQLVQGAEEAEEKEQRPRGLVSFSLLSFDLEGLLQASAETLGKGSVGSTYKGTFEDGTIVAVKRLTDVWTGKKDFEAHVQVLGKLQHPNIVPLLAYYFSKDEKILVFDYTSHSLSALLHGDRSHIVPMFLDWLTRVRIAIGAARGLVYLHAQGGPNFQHGNIKSSNVLLDRDLLARISDFGLLKLRSTFVSSPTFFGYRAPEVKGTRNFEGTQKSDVYSFGVLLLELLTGKDPTQASANGDAVDLPKWVQSIVREEWTAEVFDLELMRYQNIEGEMVSMLQIAMQCVDPVPERRPKMSHVLSLLEDVHPFFIENGAEPSRQSESASEDMVREIAKDSERNSPSNSGTP